MCQCYKEMVDHLLIHCDGAYQLWSFVFWYFGVSAWSVDWVDELVGEHSFDIWNLIPLCLVWCIWRERNICTFEHVESSGDQLLASFVGTSYDWSQIWELTSSDSLPNFIDSSYSKRGWPFHFNLNNSTNLSKPKPAFRLQSPNEDYAQLTALRVGVGSPFNLTQTAQAEGPLCSTPKPPS